jgi:quinoprotein glucose dehydrogenase
MTFRNCAPLLIAAALTLAGAVGGATAQDWPVYGGDRAGTHYSGLTQINRSNVTNLQEAWRYEFKEGGESQTNPLMVGRTLYAYTPSLKVIALDAATGRLKWSFDAGVRASGPHRGLTYWTDGKESRLFAGVMNVLYALDPATGKPITSFGDEGGVDLRQGLGGDPAQHFISLTTPGIVYQDLIVVGFRTVEVAPAPAGDIRAYDVHTGKLRWSFHTIPHPGEKGYETWPQDAWKSAGAANSWGGFALDEQRGIVYAPTGSAVSDFYGDDRHGDNLYANSLIALDAATGRRLWHFQAVHHDIWDRDFPSPPVLVTLNRNGKRIDAVAQTSKQGFVYVFDRVTGKSLYPIVEKPVPPSSVPGERAAATQPFPLAPAPFARQQLTEELLSKRTPEVHAWALEQFHGMRSAGQFLPLTVVQPTVVFPGFDGGAEWGGSAVDPVSGVLYVNANDVAWTGSLVASVPGTGIASAAYQAQCAACHGADRKGSPPAFPSLVDVDKRLSTAEIGALIRSGKGRMPAFPGLPGYAVAMLTAYLRSNGVEVPPPAPTPGANARREMTASMFTDGKPVRYRFSGYNKFLDKDGYPAVAPPWGTLNAIDLNTGKYLWKIPLGNYPELAAMGMADTGSENYGGPVITAGGLLFIGASIYDHKLRAFDRDNGQLLWDYELPYAGTATPATYTVDGRQYVVIATSNARNGKAAQGSAYVAFALPDNPLRLRGHHVTASVKDIDRAVKWYQEVLGFTLAERGNRGNGMMQFAELKIPGFGVALVWLRDAPTAPAPASPPMNGAGWLHLVFAVPDVALAYRQLKQRGADVYLRPGQPAAPLTAFLLHDSEGNEIEIMPESD